ncbi:MAG: hypothetical protein BA874_12765 [Desulfuromonadales bacterium C00003068]|nr:MAG: hypothetical protein BA874_12765 [Desulfuromonadales bacterium C00003068]
MKYLSDVFHLNRDLPDAPVLKYLSTTTFRVYLQFCLKCQMEKIKRSGRKPDWYIKNNGKIIFTYKEAEQKLNISRSSFTRAIDSLIKYGFIEIQRLGGGTAQIPTLYAIVDNWRNWETPQFKINLRPIDKRRKGWIKNLKV